MSADLIEDNGAIEVDEATEVPIKVFLAGPIKHWWGKHPDGRAIWGSPEHLEYTQWRDHVRRAIVATGFCVVYSPHRAIQGSWHPDLQKINDMAIMISDVFVHLTPEGVPNAGTQGEMELARKYGLQRWHIAPGRDATLKSLLYDLEMEWVGRRRLMPY